LASPWALPMRNAPPMGSGSAGDRSARIEPEEDGQRLSVTGANTPVSSVASPKASGGQLHRSAARFSKSKVRNRGAAEGAGGSCFAAPCNSWRSLSSADALFVADSSMLLLGFLELRSESPPPRVRSLPPSRRTRPACSGPPAPSGCRRRTTWRTCRRWGKGSRRLARHKCRPYDQEPQRGPGATSRLRVMAFPEDEVQESPVAGLDQHLRAPARTRSLERKREGSNRCERRRRSRRGRRIRDTLRSRRL
jgi:hypothetical protein